MLVTWALTLGVLVLVSILWAQFGQRKPPPLPNEQTASKEDPPPVKRSRVKSMDRAVGSPHRRSKSVITMGDALVGLPQNLLRARWLTPNRKVGSILLSCESDSRRKRRCSSR